jgi:hypothetical protein
LRSSRKARPTNLQSRFLEQICAILRTILREGCILLPEFVRRELMRSPVKAVCLLAILTFGAAGALGTSGAEPANDRRSIVIVFKDGHRQSLLVADIARIEFKTPVTIVFKSGREQDLPATDIARIEFETSASALLPSRNHFLGKWEVGEGNGFNFYISLEADGEAKKSIGSSHGTWTVVDGEARISWDDGWHDAIRKVGAKHEKFAYEPGKSFTDKPTNVTAARNTEPQPI